MTGEHNRSPAITLRIFARLLLFAVTRLVLCCAIMCVCAWNAQAKRAPAPAGAEIAQPSAVSDTLRYQVRAGEPLIIALPRLVDGRETTYRLLEAPALSWLVDRSFLWRTTPGERGQLPIVIERLAEGALPDQLVLLVDVLPA